jgi:hypothetical protein
VSRARLVLAAAVALAACSSEPKPAPPPPAPRPAPRPVAPPAPPRISLPPAPISVPPPPPPDQCGAYALQGLVGKPRTEIPVPVNPSRRRVICSTCPRTLDFSPFRLTIVYDQATGRVISVGCN